MPGPPPFSYSLHFQRDAAGDLTRFLVATGGVRLELSSAQDPSGLDSIESVTDPDTKERLARRLLLSGYEGVPSCASVKPPDACVLFRGSGDRLVGAAFSDFAGEKAPALRAKVAALVSKGLDAKIEKLAPLFPRTAELAAYGDDFLRLVWPGRFPRPASARFEQGRRRPGCDFDARFGYPCNEAELRRDRAMAR